MSSAMVLNGVNRMFNPEQRVITLQILRLPNVIRMTGLCRSAIYQLESNDRFPKRISLGSRTVGWLEHEVQEWLAQRVTASRSHAGH